MQILSESVISLVVSVKISSPKSSDTDKKLIFGSPINFCNLILSIDVLSSL